MAQVQRIARTGGPEVFEWVTVDLPPPAPGEVRLRATAIGLNYIDVYHRTGLYPVELPAILGAEGVGVVEDVGREVDGFAPGDRVATFGPARGAYATHRNVAADLLVRLPDDVADADAAAVLLKGATAWFLVERCARVIAGQDVLVHAAAGGVGTLLCGWLRDKGARVIGVVGSEAKVARATEAGADAVILRSEDIAQRVRELTDGAGVPVIFDGVGRASWGASLDSAARLGLIVSYGNASGPVNGVNLGTLAAKGSLFVTRPTLFDYARTPGDRQAAADAVFAMLAKGAITAIIGQRFPLRDVGDAHRAIESGDTVGSTILLP